MVTKYRHQNVTWIDLESPTKEEVRSLVGEYAIHPVVADELLHPTVKPRVEYYNNSFIYLILHFPAFRHTHKTDAEQEVDFIIGKDFLITTRYDTIDPMHEFTKIFEVNSILERSDMGRHAGYLFFSMIRLLYKSLDDELDHIRTLLEEIESSIFSGQEKEMVFELSRVARILLNFKQALRLHREVLESFEQAGIKFFGDEFTYQLKSIVGEYYRVRESIEGHIDTLAELRETNNAMVSTKQNEIIKTLTTMAFITVPLSLFASIFSMNTLGSPLTGFPGDFWVIIGFMALISTAFLIFFKFKKWL